MDSGYLFSSRNIDYVTLKVVNFYYLKMNILWIEVPKKTCYLTVKTEALVTALKFQAHDGF